MAKTMREIETNVKHVDLVIELVDARTPYSSQNPFLQPMIKNKQKVILLMKADLADETCTREWIDYFEQLDNIVLPIHVNDKKHIDKIIAIIDTVRESIMEKRLEKGI